MTNKARLLALAEAVGRWCAMLTVAAVFMPPSWMNPHFALLFPIIVAGAVWSAANRR